MLKVISGWDQLRKKSKPRRRARDTNRRHAGYEELEQRCLLAVNYFNVAESLDAQLDAMQGRLTTALNFFQTGGTSSIPIIGDQLGRASDVVSSFSDELRLGLQDLGVDATPTDVQIQTALSARLNTFLAGAGPGDVQVSHAGSNTTIEMLLQGSVELASVDIGFETGLPSLPIKVLADGEIDVTVGYALDLSFTIDASGNVTLNEADSIAGVSAPDADHPIVDPNNGLAIFVSAELSSDFTAKAIFGFVEGTATPIAGMRNGLYGTALVSNLLSNPTIKLDGSADANLRLTGSFAGTNNDFPGISTDFHLHWGLSSAAPASGAPTVSFDNVSLSFGTFLSNALRPVLEPLQDTLDPIEPVLELLDTDVPGLNDLSQAAGLGPFKVVDLAVIGSTVAGVGPLGELGAKVNSVLTLLNSINLGPNVTMPLGGFDLDDPTNGDLRSAAIAGDFTNLDMASLTQFAAANLNQAAQGAEQAYRDLVDDLGVSQDVKDQLNGLVTLPTQNGFQIAFPILDDPAGVVFNMLLGKDSDLFYFQADANIELGGQEDTGMDFAGQDIKLVGQGYIDTHFKFGYDTYGLRQLIRNLAAGDASHIVSDITDGFYISDDTYFKMAGEIKLEAEGPTPLNAVSVSVEGGIYTQNQGATPIHVYIEDPNGDGKLRFNEFFDTGTGTAAFKTTGVLTAELNISIDFFDAGGEGEEDDESYTESLNIASVELLEFSTPTPLYLASAANGAGNTTLYLGVNAGQRTGGGGGDDGNEKFSIYHKESNPDGSEDIEIHAFGLRQVVENVRNIIATDAIGELTIMVMPGVTSNVNLTGGQGPAFLSYRGSGAGTLVAGATGSTLIGGPGSNTLFGAAGNDTIILGSGANTVDGGAGQNTIIVKAPISQNGTINGGATADNTLQILGHLNTVAISAMPVGAAIDLAIQNTLAQPAVHLTLTNFDDVYVTARDSNTSFAFGDLSIIGVDDLTLNMVSPFPTTRMVEIDSRAANLPATVAIDNYVASVEDPLRPGIMINASGAVIANSTTGLTTRLIGWRNDDSLTLHHHGGLIDVDALAFSSGNFVIDVTSRLPGQANMINITTPSLAGGINLVMSNDSGDVLMASTNYLDFRIEGSTPLDTLNLYVSAATSGANTLWFDASALQGEFNVYMAGGASAIHHATLSKAGPQTDVSIFGQTSTTDLRVATGQLQLIRHDVYASNVQLTIDNDEAPLANILRLNATTFGQWLVPALGTMVQLNFNNLRSGMEIFAGAGDRFQLDVTPPSISSLTIRNASMTVQDMVYVATWAVPLALIGNFSLFAGQRIHSNGTVERLKRLLNINAAVTLDYQGNGPSQMVLDGDLDAPGAQYVVNAVRPVPPSPERPHFIVNNQTVGLNVKIYGYQQVDTIYVYMPGATVNSNLREKVPATIYFDGRNRLAGTNPTSPNNINMLVAAGVITMTPEGTYDSKLQVFNTVYVLGAMPQDALNVTQPTEFRMASTAIGQNQIRFDYALNGSAGFTVTSPTARYTVHSTVAQLPTNPLNPNPLEVVPTPITPITSFVDRAIMYQDLTLSPLEAQKVAIRGNTIPWTFNVGGVFVTIPVEVIVNLQVYPPNPNPLATDNHVNIDASQLRGTFGFQVSEPDYAYAELLADGLARGSGAPATNFGQSYVTISKTNPQLTTTITGTTPTNTAHYNPLVAHVSGNVSRWAGMQVTVGTGDLGTLQGNLTVNQAWLKEVDNRNAALASIIQLTTAGVNWDAGDGGRTSLTLNNLHGKLTVSGSAVDRFAVEGTPNSAYRTVLRNFSTAATPSGVYVMGKNVMPLEVSGNFDLAVGRRLNLDGSVTNVGTILGVYDDVKNYVHTGSVVNFSGVWQDFELRPTTTSIAGPLTWSNSGYLISLVGGAQPKPPLPIYYNYSGLGQGIFVFDASNETVTDRVLGDMIVQYGGASLNGISSNSNYAGKANLRFYESEVIYGPNTSVYWYGAKLRTNTSAFDVMAPTLFNNVLNGAVYYFANPANVGQNPIEQILVGNTLGPVYIEGSGRNTRVEINPLFSLPTSLAMGIFDTSINNQSFAIGSHPGWGGGHTGGYSLIDTIQANVSVSGAALRVIGDIPRPVGSPPITSRPNVTIGGSSMTGIATGTIHYANLADSVLPGTFTFNSQLDLNPLRFPGLNVQLPAHFPVDATVQNTPAGATTQITTVLSSANNTHTNGVLNVLGTTGKLILGDMYGVTPTNGDKFTWPGLAGSMITSWSDGISFSQINIGNGSLAGIQGEILLKGDSHTTTTTVTNIDGRNDAARSNVVFTRPSYSSNPFPTQFVPYQQVDGLASAPIYFGQFYQQTHPLNIYGSAGSAYNVISGPVNMNLYAGAGSSTTLRGTPLTVFGGSTVTMLMPTGLTLPNFTGVPEFHVQQDPANPAPINIIVERTDASSSGNFRLESTGNGMMRIIDRQTFFTPPVDYWRLNYKGSDATVSLNYSNIIIADTGSLGTTASSKAATVNVHGTTSLLKILPVGVSTGNAAITLGNNGNMQAILGNVEITQGAGTGSFSANNANDTGQRTINMSHTGGVFTVTGMSPGLIKFFGTGGAFLYGGSGGSTFIVENIPAFASYLNLQGGSSNNDTLVGPNINGSYDIVNTNYTFLNSKVVADRVENLRGGSANDTFRFWLSGSNIGQLTGGVDGGLGTDTVIYDNSNWWRFAPYDLSIGRLPLAAGISSSIERAPFDVLNPGTRTNPVGQTITPLTIGRYGGPLNVTWSATNLPAGLSINTQTGVISGTISPQAAGNRTVSVSATDGTYNGGTSFTWTLQGPTITNPGTQTTALGSAVNLAITASGGGTNTFSASNLPAGLTINSQTGVISGTVAAQTAGNRTVTVSVFDGINTGSANFLWTLTAHTITSPGNQTFDVGETISPISVVANNANFPLTWSASGLPNGLTINAQTGVISGTIVNQSGAVGSHGITVSATDGFNLRNTNFTLAVEGFGLIDPGTLVSSANDPISLQINSVGAPSGVLWSAIGLPVGLSIDSSTGLVTGTIDEVNATTGEFEVHVVATDGTVTADVYFDWRVIGFSISSPGNQYLPEGAPLAIPLTITNLQNEELQYTVNVSGGHFFSVENGVLRGAIYIDAPSTGIRNHTVTVTVSNGFATDQTSFTLTTYDGYYTPDVSNRGNYAGAVIGRWMDVYSPYGHNLSVVVTGLPEGLTIDAAGWLEGTISNSAVSATPHQVTFTITNNTLNDADGPGGPEHTYTYSFDWTVRRLPTAAELNAGTPDGVPELVTVFNPDENPDGPDGFHGVTYGSGSSQHTIVYRVNNGKLWQVANGVVSVVQSVDPIHTEMPAIYGVQLLAGRGLVFGDSDRIWIVDEAGARPINEVPTRWFDSFVDLDGTFHAAGIRDEGEGWMPVFLSIEFDANGDPILSAQPRAEDLYVFGAFAGGVLATQSNPDGSRSMYWVDMATGAPRILATTFQGAFFQSVLVGAGAGGTTTLYMVEYMPGFGQRVRAINSAQLGSPSNPTVVDFPMVPVFQGFPTLVGDKLVYGSGHWNGAGEVIRFTVTDGTLAGTTTITTPLTNNFSSSSVWETLAVGTDLYFSYQAPFEFDAVQETTLTTQVWKLDTLTGTLTNILDLFGWNGYYNGPSWLEAVEDRIYFVAWNQALGARTLWSYDATNGTAAVASYESNPYLDPYGLASIDGALYFNALSSAVPQLSNNSPSLQAWVIRPAEVTQPLEGDFNFDGSVDAADYVMWRRLGMSTPKYNDWRQNFGETQSGGGAAATSPSSAESFIAQAAPVANAPLQEQQAAMSLPEIDLPPVDSMPSVRETQSFNIDFDLRLSARFRETSLVGTRTTNSIESNVTRRDDLLTVYQAVHAIDERFATPTAFDMDWHTAADVHSDDFDIDAIDDAFSELNLACLK